jgi:hypothetical protein
MMEMGIDRILFSVDYPFAENPPGTEWLKTLPLGPEDTEKLLNGNARRLLKLERGGIDAPVAVRLQYTYLASSRRNPTCPTRVEPSPTAS